MTRTTEVSDSLERVDSIINMLDEICDHMDGFSSAEEAWLSSITETLRTWRYVMQETAPGLLIIIAPLVRYIGRPKPCWIGIQAIAVNPIKRAIFQLDLDSPAPAVI